MGTYKEINGNLITRALNGDFDVIAHGCNCFCTMGAGIAPQMVKAFGCDKFELENYMYKGDINKLGQIDYSYFKVGEGLSKKVTGIHNPNLVVVNAYTQYMYGTNHTNGVSKPLDYDALQLCMRKINHIFKGKHIGLPKIGAGLARGNWEVIKIIIQTELKDMDVTIINYDK